MMKFSNSGNKLSLENITEFESKHNIKLPELYIRFLLEQNGGYPERSTFRISSSQGNTVLNVFFGIGDIYDNLDDYLDIYEDRMPSSFIPIADDPGGNVICLGIGGDYCENIFFWDHEQENDDADMSNMYFLARNIYEFIEALHD
ncbi:MAG: SMI1/KNR4 family protein [Peptococcaceae bacterium]|nr:SMI1/KNR4 family protein [Peptococcaceae bacterium]